mgnify:CR=1 FL=1
MHLRIDSHSGFAKGPVSPTREPSRLIAAEHADCPCLPCNLSKETPSKSQGRPCFHVLLTDAPGLYHIPDSNRNNRIQVDPHINQPIECRTNPFDTLALPHPFSIDLFDAGERKHSPPGEPKFKDTVPPWIPRKGHTLTQSSLLVRSQAFLQNHSFYNQVSFDS